MNKKLCSTNIICIVIIFLISANVEAVKVWQPLGPARIENSNLVENISKRPTVGAVNAIAPHPTDANIIYIATVAGGIWKTENALDNFPSWVALGTIPDANFNSGSLSTSDITFDRFDTTYSTLVASFGRYSSYFGSGGSLSGVMRSNDNGATWTDVSGCNTCGVTNMVGKNINNVGAYSTVVMATVDKDFNTFANTCDDTGVFASFNAGSNWFKMGSSYGLPAGPAYSLEVDRGDLDTYYVGISTKECGSGQSGLYKTTDFGQSWSLINSSLLQAVNNSAQCASGTQYEISVGSQSNLHVSIYCQNELVGIFRGTGESGETNWIQLDLPGTFENGVFVGVNPGGQSFIHRSLVTDPTNDDIVYIGGDRQPNPFPNSIGANAFSGRLFRGNALLTSNGEPWDPLTHSGTASNSAPHADSRDMVFDAAGSLLEADDGGIYKRIDPRSYTGDWVSLNGNLQISEIHSSDYDSVTKTVVSGLQDNGTNTQEFLSEKTWHQVLGGDGGDVAVDNISLELINQSIRYSSTQNLGAFNYKIYDENNQIVGSQFYTPQVVSGNAFVPQFYTPISLNQIAPVRMIFGMQNSIYESLDLGETISEIGPGLMANSSFGNSSIAYGTDVNLGRIWVAGTRGSENGVFYRDDSGAPFVFYWAAVPNLDGSVTSIAMDSTNPGNVFWVSPNRVIWNDPSIGPKDITSNIRTLNPPGGIGAIQNIVHTTKSGLDVLAVGTSNGGIYWSFSNMGNFQWFKLGTDLPPVPIYSLEYNENDDVLIVGTFGRGEYILKRPFAAGDAPLAEPFELSMNLLQGSTSTSLTDGSISLLNNFSDDPNETLTVESTPVKQPMNGLLTLNPNGSFSYQHDGSMTNTDEFYYRVCDNGTPQLCNDAKVNISIDFGSNYLVCSSPNIGIPDGDPITGASDILTVMQSGLLSDLTVGLEINHTYVGDLIVKLVHASSGTEVTLIDRPGVPASGFGCAEDNVSTVLSDAELLSVENQCDTPMAINGRFIPNNSLSTFNNLELSGNWSLKVTDSENQDTGALISWCLDPVINDDIIFLSGFE